MSPIGAVRIFRTAPILFMGKGQVICAVVIALLGIISIPMTFAGIIPVF